MKILLRLVLLALASPLHAELPAPIPREAVAILYNSALPESRELAAAYAQARAIPENHLLGIDLPDTGEISRSDFNQGLRDPLAAEFLRRGWLTRERTPEGTYRVTKTAIKVLVCMRGVPYKIPTSAPLPRKDEKGQELPRWHLKQDDASVDGELALLGNTAYALPGPLENSYFKSSDPIVTTTADPFLLVGRIDGPSWETCRQLIKDTVEVEKTGLWGMCYLDFAKKSDGGYQLGDDWIESIARTNRTAGIATVIDRHRDTYVTNYPMTHAGLYFGWYTTDRNGPFLNKEFRFRKGAVAVHLHSFSATDLRNAGTHWTGPLLAAGAAATVGNVWEPFLQLTHHFDILHDRLLRGFTLAEASYMALPSLSWQAVVIGDPLYRPFARFDDAPGLSPPDKEFVTLRESFRSWPNDEETRIRKMRTAAAKAGSGLIYEALGLSLREQNEPAQAAAFFNSAAKHYQAGPDRLRQELHLIDMAREAGRNQEALTRVRTALPKYQNAPEGKALAALLTILDPPAPPPVEPGKTEDSPPADP